MKIEDKERDSLSLRQATLCFLMKDDEILLAMKKRGFGEGRWNGTGGKPQGEETIEETAARETNEEVGVKIKDLEKVATINFYFPHNSNWNQQVIVYLSENWEGEPSETEEMFPQWYKKDNLPFDSMWADDIYWLPLVLEGKKLKAEFIFGEGDIVLDFRIEEIN